jgi:hypothetical protein
MVKYICIYCDKESVKKSNYDYHFKSCEKKFTNIIEKYKKYSVTDMLKEYANAITNIPDKNNKLKCDICNKKYETYTGLKKHVLKNDCSNMQLDICNKIKKKYNVSNNQTNINSHNTSNVTSNITSNIKTQNNNTQNNYNINNNMKLVPYDDIKYDFMKPSVLKDAFEVPGEAFQSITADTFFDPENKENHVIYCPNLKDTQIHVYNGNKFSDDGWDVVEKKDFFKQMLTNQIRTLEKIKRCNDLDENPLEINNIVGFANLLKEFNANNDVIKEYTTKLNTLCWKNNPIVKKTKEESKEIKIQKMIQKALAN